MKPIIEALQTEYVKPTKESLYRKQKEILDTFLAHKAITEAQYIKSLRELTLGMGM